MGLEERLRRIEYLERLSERAEKALVYLAAYGLLAPLLQGLAGVRLAAVTAAALAAATPLAFLVYKTRLEIEEHWGQVLGRDPRILAFPWIGLAAIIILLGALLATIH